MTSIACLNLLYLEPVSISNGFEDLIIPPGHKRMVKALVRSHASGHMTPTVNGGIPRISTVHKKGIS